jgi:hypothetical protein
MAALGLDEIRGLDGGKIGRGLLFFSGLGDAGADQALNSDEEVIQEGRFLSAKGEVPR